MRVPGKSNKALAGLAPFDRHGFERFGASYGAKGDQVCKIPQDIAQRVGFVSFVLSLERDSKKVVRDRAPGWWKSTILPGLESELRRAVDTNDGTYFRQLADCIDARGKPPIDPLREWVCRLFDLVSDRDGVRYEQRHTDKTSVELHLMFRKSKYGYPVDFEVFTNTLREMGVRWKKHSGGRPSKNSHSKGRS